MLILSLLLKLSLVTRSLEHTVKVDTWSLCPGTRLLMMVTAVCLVGLQWGSLTEVIRSKRHPARIWMLPKPVAGRGARVLFQLGLRTNWCQMQSLGPRWCPLYEELKLASVEGSMPGRNGQSLCWNSLCKALCLPILLSTRLGRTETAQIGELGSLCTSYMLGYWALVMVTSSPCWLLPEEDSLVTGGSQIPFCCLLQHALSLDLSFYTCNSGPHTCEELCPGATYPGPVYVLSSPSLPTNLEFHESKSFTCLFLHPIFNNMSRR